VGVEGENRIRATTVDVVRVGADGKAVTTKETLGEAAALIVSYPIGEAPNYSGVVKVKYDATTFNHDAICAIDTIVAAAVPAFVGRVDIDDSCAVLYAVDKAEGDRGRGDLKQVPVQDFMEAVCVVAEATKADLVPYFDTNSRRWGAAFKPWQVVCAVGGADAGRWCELVKEALETCKKASRFWVPLSARAHDVTLKLGGLSFEGQPPSKFPIKVALYVSGVLSSELASEELCAVRAISDLAGCALTIKDGRAYVARGISARPTTSP
jgi:hypothetical protein